MEHPEFVRDESIGSLVRGILEDLRTLTREQIALCRVELREQASRARAVALSYAVMAAALGIGGLFLLVAAAAAIADRFQWPMWAGFLTVALGLCVVGLVSLAIARRQLRKVHALPRQTVTTLKENAAWIARRISSDRK